MSNFQSKQKIKPKRLAKGATLGLIAPASQLSDEDFDRALAQIKQMGFTPKYSDRIRLKNGFLAGDDEMRLLDLHTMFADPEVDGILCLRGGYGSARLLSQVDYDLIQSNPKIFIGYSDITALLAAFSHKIGLVGFHGPMGGSNFTEFTAQGFWNAVNGHEPPVIYSGSEGQVLFGSDKESVIKGEVIGGNLSILCSLLGTSYNFDYQDKILVIEEVGEAPYRVDRMLTQLINTGELPKVKAVAFGTFSDFEEQEGRQSLMEVLTERMQQVNIPGIYGLQFGHITDNATLPFGINAELDFNKLQLNYLELPVI